MQDDKNIRKWSVRMAVGRMAYDAGLFNQAARHFREALNESEECGLPDAPRARSLVSLAKALSAVGQFEEAEHLLTQAITIDEADNTTLVDEAEDYHQLSLLYWRSGRPERALAIAQRAWNLLQRSKDAPDELKAKLLKHFAVLAEQAGKLDECERYLNEAIDFIERSSELNRHSSIYGDVLLVKVLLLAERGRIDEALELYPLAIQIVEINRGIKHPRVGEVLEIFDDFERSKSVDDILPHIRDDLERAQQSSKHGII